METNLNTIALIFSMATVLAIPAAAQAQAPEKKRGDASGEHRPPHEPPPQAYTNCKDKKEGDKVEILTPREGKISATCTPSPKGLFARPDRPPGGNMNADGRPSEKK